MPSTTQYGPFTVTRPLVRAPGAHFLEGSNPTGGQVILQVVHLNPPSADDKSSHAAFVEAVERATDELSAVSESPLLGHGMAVQEDGSNSLYWAIPWTPGAELLGIALDLPTVDNLSDLATSLLQRVVERQAAGRLDPLLCPETVVLVDGSTPHVIGFPIHLPAKWRSADVRPAPLAPEEESVDEPRRSGDLWRVGRVLEVVGAQFPQLPPQLEECVARLTARDPAERYQSAEVALIAVEAAHNTVPLKVAPSGIPWFDGSPDDQEEVDGAQAPASAAWDPFEEKTQWDVEANGQRTASPPPSNARRDGTPQDKSKDILRQRPTIAEADVAAAEPTRRIEPEPRATLLERPEQAPTPNPDFEGPLPEPPTVIQGPSMRPTTSSSSTIRPAAPRTGSMWDAASQRAPASRRPVDRPPNHEIEQVLDVRGRPVPEPDRRARARRASVRGAGPGTSSPARRPGSREPPVDTGYALVPPARELSDQHLSVEERLERLPTADLKEDLRPVYIPSPIFPMGNAPAFGAVSAPAPRPRPHRGWIAVAFFAGIITSAVALFVFDPPGIGAPASRRAAPVDGPASVTPAFEVLLQASPANAIVISERTGRILGTPPIRFLVPEANAHAIFIAAPGHEPQRLVLPLRGRLKTDLVPLLEDMPPCQLRLTAAKGVELEAVAAPVQFGALATVYGAAVVRSNQGQGAWLVRCPRLGGSRRQVLAPHARSLSARLVISGPKNAEIAIDNETGFRTPLDRRVPTGFRKIQITQGDAEATRFIPVFRETEVWMPKPRPR